MTTEEPAAPSPKSFHLWISSPAAKAAMILALLLLMQIPLLMVANLISEREGRQNEVLTSFRQNWGPAQTVLGPVLAVPFDHIAPGDTPHRVRHWVRMPPGKLSVSAKLEPESRRRGLFHAVVYTASLNFNGTITVPRIDESEVPQSELIWNEAVLVTGSTDLRGMPAGSAADIDGHTTRQSIRTLNGSCGGVAVAPAQLAGPPLPGSAIPFSTSLVLHGTQSLNFLPNVPQMDLFVSAPWRSPGFTGSSLPATYGIDHAGFHANWAIVGDAVSGSWSTSAQLSPVCLGDRVSDGSLLGVELLEQVPTYLMVTRASKYGTLFLALSFLTYFIFEALSRVRIHLAQYVLLGLSVSLFALLLIALAEPLGFTAGYILSTVAVMAQASLYTLSVVGSARLAAMFAGVLGLLFGFLYVVLCLETFSLLVGAVALFGALSVIMFVTHRLDWSGRGAANLWHAR
jgi:inner membrane protein